MATYSSNVQYTYGEYEEIAFTSRNDMNLAVWEGEGRVRLYNYTQDDPFRERVGRFLHYGLTQLWDSQSLMDLKVTVGGQLFRCHKAIMASISGFFQTELTSEQFRRRRRSGSGSGTDSGSGEGDDDGCDAIVLDENYVSPEMFELLLDMIYTGRNIVKDEYALDLMKAACYLRIKALEFRVLDILIKQISERSCMKIWDWAEKNNVPSLASKAKGVALTFFQVLRHTEDFLRVPLERLTLMLSHELLYYQYEDDILEAILDWVEFNLPDRRQHLKELLPFVCFPYLSTRYLNDLRKHPLIGLRSEFSTYVDEALTYHLAALQKNGKKIQMEVLKRQAHSLKRLMPGMRRVVLLIGGAVVQDEPLTNVVACYMDLGHPQSRYRELLQFSVASLPMSLGLCFASTMWKHDVFVSGGSRAPDTLLVYKPHENAWKGLKAMPQGRQNHAMVATDSRLYVLGGKVSAKGGSQVIADISFYDIDADTWTPVGKLPVAVESAPAVLLADKIYVFGGRTVDGSRVDVVQALDVKSGVSQVVGQLPEGVEGARAVVLGKDMVLVTPQGSVYTVHEGTRRTCKVTFADSPEYADDLDLLSSLDSFDSLAPKAAIKGKEAATQGKEEEEEKQGSTAPAPGKDKGARGGEVDWSILDIEGKERVPKLRVTTDHDPATPPELLLEEGSDAAPLKTNAGEEEKEKKTPAADAQKTAEPDEEDDDQSNGELEKIDMKELEADLTESSNGKAAADSKGEQEDKAEEKVEKKDDHVSDKTDKSVDVSNTAEAPEKKRPEDSDAKEEADEEEGEEEEEKEEEENDPHSDAPKPAAAEGVDIVITKIATMEKRRDFGLFIRKTDVMVVGGQSENGFFLDDILRIHVPTGQVCKMDGKLLIPLSGMQVECTTIHQNYLLQFFDAASCFYGE